MQAAAEEFRRLEAIPFAGFCSDPCDGRTQGTTGMFDSLPYRNDAAVVFRRLARSLPLRAGVLGIATCDKGLPAMMMAVAGLRDLPCVVVPGGVTLPAAGAEDAGTVQTLGARFAHGLVSLSEAASTGLPRVRIARAAAASFSARPRRRKWSARRWGFRCLTPRWRRRASPFGWTWHGVRRVRCINSTTAS